MMAIEKNESCWLPASAPSHWFHARCIAPVNTAICHKYTLTLNTNTDMKDQIQIWKKSIPPYVTNTRSH